MTSIKELRQNGYKVRVHHHRDVTYQQRIDGSVAIFSPKGGRTNIEISTPDGKNYAGSSLCSSQDSWNRKLGNQIALGRAVSQMLLDGSGKDFPHRML
jgi:hypothetical protein